MIKNFLARKAILSERPPLRLAVNVSILLLDELHSLITTEEAQRNADTGATVLHDKPVVVRGEVDDQVSPTGRFT